MSKLRSECCNSTGTAMPDDTALFLIRESVAKRRELIYGIVHLTQGGMLQFRRCGKSFSRLSLPLRWKKP